MINNILTKDGEKRSWGNSKMEMTRQERTHRNQSWHGYHIYLSRFFGKFKLLSLVEKQKMLGIKFAFGDNESVDSTDSRLKKISVGGILSCAGRIWSVELPTPIKEAWRKRATQLNRRHVPSKFL